MIWDERAIASPQLPLSRPDSPLGSGPVLDLSTKPARFSNGNSNVHFKTNPKGETVVFKPKGCENTKTLKDDLANFGFTAIQVKEMIGRQPTFEVDATAQRPHGHKAMESEQQAKREKREGTRARKGPKYEPLYLVQTSSE